MRIAWVTPLAQRSAIGRFSASVTAELASRGHRVRIVRSESVFDPAAPAHPTDLQVTHIESVDPETLRLKSDIAVINVGDNYLFHAGIFRMLEIMPCVGVFHDYYLMNLFNGWAAERRAGAEEYEAEIVATYGPGAADAAALARVGRLPLEAIARDIPMTEWVARRCAGALAHAEFYADRLRKVCPGPVEVAHLTVEPRGVAPLVGKDGDQVVVATVGVMNPNKCADAVIEAIAASPMLASRVRYNLVGGISDEERTRLEGLAASRGYGGLTIFGAVDDETLARSLQDADIVCCLRKPVLEGASGSAIEGLLSGRPTIVADAGFYAEIPDDYCFKVPADVPPEALTRQLERLVGDQALRREAGARAQAWAEDHFGPERYAARAEGLIQETIDALPILNLGERFGRDLADFGLAPDDPAVARIAATIEAMFPRLRPDV